VSHPLIVLIIHEANDICSGYSLVDPLRQYLLPNPGPERRPPRAPITLYSTSALQLWDLAASTTTMP